MISLNDALSALAKHRGNAIVVPVHRASMAWPQFSSNSRRDISPGAMSKASSLGLGIALSRPDTKVIVLDGDGSLSMNLGSLVTIGNKQPRNMYHFVMENGMYATTGGQPTPGKDRLSFADMARNAGYAAAYDFDDLEEFATRVKRVLDEPGPVLVCLKIVPNPRSREQRGQERGSRRRRQQETAEAVRSLRQELGAT